MILSVNNVVKSYGVDIILDGASFRLDAREKVALVGRNGAGKTTLLKLITQQETPDTGSVNVARGVKIGYLRQEAQIDAGQTVLQAAENSRTHQLELQARLEELQALLDAGTATTDDIEEYALVHEHFLSEEGYAAENDMKVVLQRMGFTPDEFDKPTEKLSGGERTRLAIAKILLEEPELLILDEPTNHLDLDATEWLEGWIKAYHGAVLLVSHDREFLENTAERVLELRDGTVKAYPGPFAKYLDLRREEDIRLAEVAKRQEQEIAKLDEFVRRFMNSQRTAQARGRLKIMERKIDEKVDAPKMESQMKGGFGSVGRSGDIVLEARDLTVGFEDLVLYKNLNLTVKFGERWGIIGENGAGKSTLIKAMLGQLLPLAGTVRVGSAVSVGYFSQDLDDLDPEMSPLDVLVWEHDMQPPEARNLLGRFLFSGDDVFRPIKSFSGGEKNKLSLARLTQRKPNLLILDEPTNHLDMASRGALVGVLKEYQGTLVTVSHDRWFLAQLVNEILDIKKSGPVQFSGTLAEYRAKSHPVAVQKTTAPAKAAAPVSQLSPREMSKEIDRLRREVTRCEEDVFNKENALRALETALANPKPSDNIAQMSREHHDLQTAIEAAYALWEKTNEDLEALLASRS